MKTKIKTFYSLALFLSALSRDRILEERSKIMEWYFLENIIHYFLKGLIKICKKSSYRLHIRVSQICTFLSNLKIYVYHNFFPLFMIKVLQKTKFWKILCIFWPGLTRPKFYYITHLCEIELSRKSDFFQVFHCKTIYIFQNSQFYIKNVFFWDTVC